MIPKRVNIHGIDHDAESVLDTNPNYNDTPMNWIDYLLEHGSGGVLDLTEVVALEFRIFPDMLFLKERKRDIVNARHCYIYILKKVYKVKPVVIAHITRIDHATVLHSVKTAQNYIETEPEYEKKFGNILMKLLKYMIKIPADPREKSHQYYLAYKCKHVILATAL